MLYLAIKKVLEDLGWKERSGCFYLIGKDGHSFEIFFNKKDKQPYHYKEIMRSVHYVNKLRRIDFLQRVVNELNLSEEKFYSTLRNYLLPKGWKKVSWIKIVRPEDEHNYACFMTDLQFYTPIFQAEEIGRWEERPGYEVLMELLIAYENEWKESSNIDRGVDKKGESEGSD